MACHNRCQEKARYGGEGGIAYISLIYGDLAIVICHAKLQIAKGSEKSKVLPSASKSWDQSLHARPTNP